jgi:hypothetical protein
MPAGLQRVHYIRLLILVALLLAGVISLALDLRPSVKVLNMGDKGISEVYFKLPDDRQFSFSDIAANSNATLYHLPLSEDTVVRFSIRLSDGQTALGRCGLLVADTWASRIELSVNQQGALHCDIH